MITSRRLGSWALLFVAFSQSACFAWKYDRDPVPVVMARKPDRVMVPIGTDSSIVLIAGSVVNDSLVGLIEGSAEPAEQLKRFSAPLSEVPVVARERLKLWIGVDHATRAAVPVGYYAGQLVILSVVVLGTIAFGAYIQAAGH